MFLVAVFSGWTALCSLAGCWVGSAAFATPAQKEHFKGYQRLGRRRPVIRYASPRAKNLQPPADLAEASPALETPWDEKLMSFSDVAEAKAVLAYSDLLSTWARRARDLLSVVDATVADVLDLSAAWEVGSKPGPLNIYFIGETGSGKSTLVRAVADGVALGPIPVETSATIGMTQTDTPVPLPSGLVLVDTRGFRIPVTPPPDSQKSFSQRILSKLMYSRQLARWEVSLNRLRDTVEETDPKQLPASVVVFVHRAGTRLVVDRMIEILSVPLRRNVPVFVVLTDVNAVDDGDLLEIRKVLADIVERVGENLRGQRVVKLEVNSVVKTVQARLFPTSGLPELVAALLNSLRPADVLQFVRRRRFYEQPFSKVAKTLGRASVRLRSSPAGPPSR